MSTKEIIETIGWAGALLYILAYLFLSIKIISSSSVIYHFLNILGAIGLIVNALHFKDAPNIIVNVVWMLIAIYAITTILLRMNKKEKINEK